MQIKSLETFIKVVELKSFTRAAKELYLSQPAISMQMKALEEELKVELFRRRKDKKLELTSAGHILHSEAREILGNYQRLMDRLQDFATLNMGHLLVGASTIPGEYVLPALLGKFLAANPGLRVSLRVAPSAAVLKMLREREISLAVCGARLPGPDLHYLTWIKDEIVFIVPPRHPAADKGVISLEELLNQPLVLGEAGSGTREFVAQALAAKGLNLADLQVIMEAGSSRAVVTAVANNTGSGFVSYLAAREADKLGEVGVVTVTGLELIRNLYITHLKNDRLSATVQAFIRFLLDHHAASISGR
ncbi:MAG TPA: LysR family transcriptional regulator [Desulfotomaculum sp.]|jgi:DNA-binding transcriptional LysR family regulator|nr:LysR family transcriptional regulator [Desulfotomaculum sp.]